MRGNEKGIGMMGLEHRDFFKKIWGGGGGWWVVGGRLGGRRG